MSKTCLSSGVGGTCPRKSYPRRQRPVVEYRFGHAESDSVRVSHNSGKHHYKEVCASVTSTCNGRGGGRAFLRLYRTTTKVIGQMAEREGISRILLVLSIISTGVRNLGDLGKLVTLVSKHKGDLPSLRFVASKDDLLE
jgi:hypothetical protein